MPHFPGIWKHNKLSTTFTFCVDDFDIKYVSKDNAMHLVNSLKSSYKITTDLTGSLYCGLTLYWSYAKVYVDIYMPGYLIRALEAFDHPPPKRPQHAPHKWIEPIYISKQQQQRTAISTANPLKQNGTTRVQSINGTFIYYSWGVYPCIIPTPN